MCRPASWNSARPLGGAGPRATGTILILILLRPWNTALREGQPGRAAMAGALAAATDAGARTSRARARARARSHARLDCTPLRRQDHERPHRAELPAPANAWSLAGALHRRCARRASTAAPRGRLAAAAATTAADAAAATVVVRGAGVRRAGAESMQAAALASRPRWPEVAPRADTRRRPGRAASGKRALDDEHDSVHCAGLAWLLCAVLCAGGSVQLGKVRVCRAPARCMRRALPSTSVLARGVRLFWPVSPRPSGNNETTRQPRDLGLFSKPRFG